MFSAGPKGLIDRRHGRLPVPSGAEFHASAVGRPILPLCGDAVMRGRGGGGNNRLGLGRRDGMGTAMDYVELDALVAMLAERAEGGRVVAAVAGAPGSGKSTVAERLCDALNARQAGMAAVLPMDGYHYDDLHLVPAGLRPRKGAPETFDVGGLYHTLKRLRARDEDFVAVPVFDRDIEIARAGARMIPAEVPVIVVEGNYLLLGQEPW